MAEGYGGAKPKTKTLERNKHLETGAVVMRWGENSCQKYSTNGDESCQNLTPSRENSLQKNSQRGESYCQKCSPKGGNCHQCSPKGGNCSQKCSSEISDGMSYTCNDQMKICVATSLNQLICKENCESDLSVKIPTGHEMHEDIAPKLHGTELNSKESEDRNGNICTSMCQGMMPPVNDRQEIIHQHERNHQHGNNHQQERNNQQGNNRQQERNHQKEKNLMQEKPYWDDNNVGNQRLHEIGKISKVKEQEYLSARERWKKSGLALRKYIADKLGFKHDRTKSVDMVDIDADIDSKRSFFDKKDTAIKPKSLKADLGNCNDKLGNTILRQTKQSDNEKGGNKLTRSEGVEVGEGMSRSKSFLRYLGLKKDRNSSKVDQGRLKASKSFEISSSDAWPESSTDTCRSPASDWSSEITLTNHHSDKKIWTNQKCQSTQTHPSDDCKCHKHHQGSKTKSGNKHKVKTHKSIKEPKDTRENTCSSLSASSKKGKLKTEERVGSKQYRDIAVENWEGILDDEVTTSSDEEYQFVFDPDCGEIIMKEKLHQTRRYSGGKYRSTNAAGSESAGRDRSQELSDCTTEALSALQYAIPYLPERFRNKLQSVQNTPIQNTPNCQMEGNLHSHCQRETNLKIVQDSFCDQGEATNHRADADDNIKHKWDVRSDKTKSDKNKTNWNKRKIKFHKDKLHDEHKDSYNIADEYERDFDASLEDPFNVRTDPNIDMCSGFLDLVHEIDIPFIDDETKFCSTDSNSVRDEIQDYDGLLHISVDTNRRRINPGTLESYIEDRNETNHDLERVGASEIDNILHTDSGLSLLNNGSVSEPLRSSNLGELLGRNLDISTRRNFEDDPDYPGMRSLNHSFNRLLGDDEIDSSTDSSMLTDLLQRSRSDESGSRSKSSDDSIEADDEFECECDHCQLLRQHSYNTNNLDLLPPRRYTADAGFSFDLEQQLDSTVPEQPDADSNTPFRSTMFLDDYDFLLDRSSNDLDWLIIDSRPLSVMLEDVIQQMLAVQPELLSEQAAPPAPQNEIENLPTISLTFTHLVQHPSCPICLCLCEIEEVMTLLPCQHIFHPICIRAWLVKSGTCPVCRAKISR